MILKDFLTFETPEDISNFEHKVAILIDEKREKAIKELLELFDDSNEFRDVLYTLVHGIESFPKEIYIPILLENMHKNIENARFWLDCLVNRIFNEPSYRDIFIKNIQMADRKALTELLDYMEIESPHHLGLINEIRNLVN